MNRPTDSTLMLESLPIVPWECEATGTRLTYVGPQAVGLLGYPLERWLDDHFWDDHVFPDDQVSVKAARAILAVEGGRHSIDYRMERADGRVVWVSETAHVVESAKGARMICGLLTDVTDRKRQEVALWKSEERVRGILRKAPEPMVLTDADGTIVNMNDQAEAMFDYRLADVIGSSIDHLVPDSLRSRMPELRAAFSRDPDRRSLVEGNDFAVLQRDGTEIPVEFSMSLVASAEDTRHILCSVHDLTARRRVEAQLRSSERRLRAQLEHVSRVATLGQLAASIAHELTQPLSAIVTNAQAAVNLVHRSPPDADEVERALRDIAADGRRAGETLSSVRQLLQRGETRMEAVEVLDLVRSVVTLLHSEAIGRGVVLAVEGSSALPSIRGDEIQLKQVFLNLLMNSIEATSSSASGPKDVHVRVTLRGSDIEAEVSDTGPGLPEGDPEELFAPFVTKRNHGLGMGLAISRSIVEAHGGEVWAEPNPNGGAVFKVRLPVR